MQDFCRKARSITGNHTNYPQAELITPQKLCWISCDPVPVQAIPTSQSLVNGIIDTPAPSWRRQLGTICERKFFCLSPSPPTTQNWDEYSHHRPAPECQEHLFCSSGQDTGEKAHLRMIARTGLHVPLKRLNGAVSAGHTAKLLSPSNVAQFFTRRWVCPGSSIGQIPLHGVSEEVGNNGVRVSQDFCNPKRDFH